MFSLSNSNMKQLIFSILLFLLPITILAQDQQQRIWLLLNKNQVVSNNESSKVSVDESILKIIQGTHIDSVNRVFPYSQNDTLQRLFEIKATINQLNHISSSPEIETIPPNTITCLRATDFIELRDGFQTSTGATLYLTTCPCDTCSVIQY